MPRAASTQDLPGRSSLSSTTISAASLAVTNPNFNRKKHDEATSPREIPAPPALSSCAFTTTLAFYNARHCRYHFVAASLPDLFSSGIRQHSANRAHSLQYSSSKTTRKYRSMECSTADRTEDQAVMELFTWSGELRGASANSPDLPTSKPVFPALNQDAGTRVFAINELVELILKRLTYQEASRLRTGSSSRNSIISNINYAMQPTCVSPHGSTSWWFLPDNPFYKLEFPLCLNSAVHIALSPASQGPIKIITIEARSDIAQSRAMRQEFLTSPPITMVTLTLESTKNSLWCIPAKP